MYTKPKRKEIPRTYFDIGGFEFRVGEFNDPNQKFNGKKMEIRILRKIDEDKVDENLDVFYALLDKIKELVSDESL